MDCIETSIADWRLHTHFEERRSAVNFLEVIKEANNYDEELN